MILRPTVLYVVVNPDLGVMKYAVDNFMEKRGRNRGVGWD
jgi:hypothetical protein